MINEKRTFEITKKSDTKMINLIGKALSSPIRIEILRLLNEKPRTLIEISKNLSLQVSSASFHLELLKNAELITIDYSTKGKGSTTWYSYSQTQLVVFLRDSCIINENLSYIFEISIGDFVDGKFSDSCGMSSNNDVIMTDEPKSLFNPSRHSASIIWNKGAGFLTYAIPTEHIKKGKIKELDFSVELCSETNGFNSSFLSDITFSFDERELCTYTSPGDFGDRFGKFTPNWWFQESTKYGLLVNVCIRENGIFINEVLKNNSINVNNLNLDKDRILFKIEVKENAEHCGGFNLFGKNFGDYNQDIVFTILYK